LKCIPHKLKLVKEKKYILVLGGNGFLGMNVISHYQQSYKECAESDIVFIVVGKTSVPQISVNRIQVSIDYRNEQELRKLLELYPIEEVFHFISTSVPATSNVNIKDDIQNNLISTLTLLELMREFNIQKIIYLSSGGTVYGEHYEKKYQEDYLSAPNNSYGVLKLTIENYIKIYQKLFGLNYLILRVSNPFGIFHQSKMNGLINIAIRKSMSNEPIQIWGDGNSTKDYIFASDFARVFWQLIELNCYNDVFNVGSGQLYSINDILGYVKTVLPNTKWVYQDEKIFDTRHSEFNIEKLKTKINISSTPILEAIESTYCWEKSKSFKL
jgi:UDP-glucose 4-epimerase